MERGRMVSCRAIKTDLSCGKLALRGAFRGNVEPSKIQQGEAYANEGISIRLDRGPGCNADLSRIKIAPRANAKFSWTDRASYVQRQRPTGGRNRQRQE